MTTAIHRCNWSAVRHYCKNCSAIAHWEPYSRSRTAVVFYEKGVSRKNVPDGLCSLPGVDPVMAVTYVATLDEASRFGSAKQVRAYLGLVPKEDISGERCHLGKITKAELKASRSD